MESFIQQKIAQSVRDRKAVHQTFVDHVKTYPSFLELEKHAFSEGALSKKAKELMALSISIVTKCEPVWNGTYSKPIWPELQTRRFLKRLMSR
jgi:alkylhydroperoxidase/carboxymuconolactone decarboxylase family protein YurZ